jgi:hypothetical protein
MIEGDFSISCGQCGGQDFQELFPVPAETYALYEGKGSGRPTRQLTAAVFACLQCGHLEKFVDLSEGNAPGAKLGKSPPRRAPN